MLDLTRKIQQRALQNAAAPAIVGVGVGGSISYFELIDKIARISNFLVDSGVPRGAKVFLNTRNPDLRLIVNIACVHCGLVPIVILDLSQIGDAVTPDVLIGAPSPFDPDLTADLVIDRSVLEGQFTSRRLREFPEPDDEDLFRIHSTAGTTGRPKVIAQSYGAYKRIVAMTSRRPTPADRHMLTIGDVTKVGVSSSFSLLCHGGTIARNHADPVNCLKVINLFCVTTLYTTPKFMDILISAMRKHEIRCPSLRMIEITGSLIRKSLIEDVEERFDADLFVSYGTSEVGGISRGKVSSRTFRQGYVGDLFPGLKLITYGSKDAPAAVNVVLEDKVFTHSLVKGKLVRNDSTFFHVPDIGYVEGVSIYLQGRKDEVCVNTAGSSSPTA